ncbi:M4 family metallopeptidase [uncultured Kordia sp.]|uniref:M4 family metallopeptidase n=1 Tax=uncultured Kordia sp. TaxID=507699 RepID=UPI002601CEEF|nr:M4 family metallopeptidase [uncultured Kordia sp.]
MNRSLLLLLPLLLSFNSILAQDNYGKVRLKKIKQANQRTTDQSIFQSEIQPISGTEFRLIKTETDKLGMQHFTYQQYYNGVKVEFGILKSHKINGNTQSFNGAYFNPTGISTQARISKSSVYNIAKNHMRTSDIFWVNADGISKDNQPEPELIILPNRRDEILNLAYSIGIGTSKPELKMGVLYIDAITGKVLKYKNLVFSCFDDHDVNDNQEASNTMNTLSPFVSGTAATVYSGSQNIETTLESSDYILYDQTRANTGQAHNYGSGQRNGIVTVNFNHNDDLNNYGNSAIVTDFTDANNNWTAADMSNDEDQYALDAHWGAQVVYDYWKNEHGRNSYDDLNSTIASYVHFDTDYTNAGWVAFNSSKGFMVYGDGAGSFTPLTNLDVVSHEIGHGVTNSNSNLDYELESGALNEGFSDIWAIAIDNYSNNAYGTSKNFELLNDENGGGTLRSMSNPNTYGQPDTYGGTYWYDVSGCTPNGTANDYCGVHTNSGVLAHWFWLLSQGGSGTNDNGDSFTVTGIGIEAAAAIAVRMESVYLTSTSDYADARDAAIQAAKDIYGNCSIEEEEVTYAWYAVGVGNTYSGSNPVIIVDNSNLNVCVGGTGTFYAEAAYADSMIWQNDVDGSWTDLSNDTTYSGVTTNTLTVTNPDVSLDGVRFRLRFSNGCGNTSTTNFKFLYVKRLPDVTSVVPSGAGCTSTTDGSLTVNFNNVAELNTIEFSIDGGTTYPYSYADNSGTQTITDLATGDYNVWARRGGDECPIEVGTYTIETLSSPTASVDTIIEANIAEVDGIIQVSFPDEATQTQIKFSVDGGISYPFVFDDSIGTGELTGLAADTYNVWVTYGDELCFKDLGNFTITEVAYTQIPDANFENALYNLGYDNYQNDNKVPTSLINTITSLNVRVENIADLTGIENFTALETLYADNNSLTTVDVSSNTALKELIAYNNPSLSSFSIADPSIITRITLSNCNLSGGYDFSAYTSLVNFSVQGNDLTGLNIKNGNNTNFTYFHAGGNSSLTCILVDDAAWSTTNWTQNGGATFSSTFCDYTAIPDLNFENALEALGYDDISSDGQVPTSLIEVVTELDVSNEGITNLTGIQDFVALESLRLNNNSLTSLDVSNLINLRTLWAASGNVFSTIDVSNNTLLEDFRLRQYSGATIDLSTNTALTRFNCTSCDFLTVDTSSNTNLVNLDLWNSNITSLDLSLNTNLETLDVYSTNLTTLDLSNNTSLTTLIANDITTLSSLNIQNGANTSITGFNTSGTPVNCILVDDPAWSTTNWTNIDGASYFSLYCDNYTLIPDLNFEAALEALGHDDISGDGQVPTALIEVVASLDVSNQSISDLTGIEDFTDLTDLICSNNSLTSLDVSSNVNLQNLDFDNNNVANLVLGTNTNLSEVSGRYNQLTSVDVSANTGLTNLNLRNNTFSTVDVSNNTNLRTLNLNQTGVTSLDVTNNVALAYLYLSGNALMSIDFTQNPLLENVNLTNSDLTSIDLSNQTVLRIIRLSGNNLTELDLTTNVALTQVECADNNLSSFNFKNGFNQIITDFDASGNPNLNCILIDDLNKDYTFWIKDVTTSFSDTYCRYTAIPDANFEAALEALGYDDISADGQVPTALIEVITDLNVDSEGILDVTGIEDFTALVSLSCFNNALTTIDLSNNLNLESLMLKENSLSTLNVLNNTELVSLRISDNNIATLDVSNNVNLSTLRCDTNNLTALDVSNNTQLVNLDVYNMATLTSLNIDSNVNLQSLKANNTGIMAIDFSNNPLLTLAYLHQTSIANVDFSQNPLLEELRVQNTQITSLDLSLQTVLTSLNCSQNSLLYLNVKNGNNAIITEFDASGNPNLACIIVDDIVNNDYSTWTKDVTTNFSETYCRYTAIPDANFESRLDALGYDDISGDNQVPTTLIENITNLDISYGFVDISDLTGLEDFTALETLDVSGHNFVTIDLSQNLQLVDLQTSNNSNLTSLDVSNNTLLKSLTCTGNSFASLDTTNNIALEYLGITGNTNLTSINVSQNLNLETLGLSGVNLTSLDVTNNTLLTDLLVIDVPITDLDLSNNVALEEIEISQTSLSFLNLKNGTNTVITDFYSNQNPSLTCILVDDATYSATNWTNVNGTASFSDTYCRYTLIPDGNFETELEALGYDDISGDGQVPTQLIEVVETLDVENKSIADLTGIEDFRALKVLDVGYNSLNTINLANNTELRQLIVRSNNLTTIDLSANTLLVGFKAENCGLTSLDVTNLLDLKILWITGNDLTAIDVSNNIALASFWGNGNDFISLDLSNNPALNSFRASSNSLTALNLQNGTNTNITGGTNFQLTGNADLGCVLVDDAAYSTTYWLGIDGSVNFSDTDCEYTLIPDANFEARLETLGYDDISGDGKVPTRLIEVVTNLNVSNQDITDLTGIEDFTALEVLLCTNNNSLSTINLSNNTNLLSLSAFNCDLTNLDVSNNTSLQSLILYGNSLTSLDVSLNTQLVELDLLANNLTALDVSNNILLQTLFVEDNNLSRLDLSNNTALTALTCSNNANLAYLNVQNGNNTNVTNFVADNNPSLTCIIVDDLANDYTEWTKDVATSFTITYCRYTAIPDANFEAALEALGYDDISADGQVPTALIEVVTSLNVNSQGIADLTGIADFTALENLECRSNSLTTLDVGANLSIEVLDCLSNVTLSTINLGAKANFTTLRAHNNNIESIYLGGCPALTDLNISFNPLTSLDLSNNTNLETLFAEETAIVQANLSMLPNLLEVELTNCSNLTYLNIQNGNNTNITDFLATGTPSLLCIIVDDIAYSSGNADWEKDNATNYTLTGCRYTAIPDANFEAALEALGYDDITADGQVPTYLIETVTNLDVKNLSIADLTGIQDFAALTTLNCSSNSLTTLNVNSNTALESLNFSRNTIAAIDVTNNVNLKSINAFENNLTTIDLSQNTILENLDIDTNFLTALDVSANTLLESLDAYSNSIVEVDLSNNLQLIGVYLSFNTITSLDLSNHTLLEDVECIDCELTSLNIKNGNNGIIGYFDMTSNPNLTCILVDDVTNNDYSSWSKDITASFNDTYCHYTAIPDANFEAALEALGYDDITNDGQVPTALIEVVTSLDVRNEGITEVTGIEDFIALETFNCNLNNIAVLDVSTNVNLTALQCTANPIESLNLTNNTLLEELNCRGTDITSLDVTNNTLLKRLICFDTDIVTLDLSQNLLLEDLYCYNTTLTSLNLSLNTALEIVQIYNNELENLDVKNGNNTNVNNFNASGNPNLSCIRVDDLVNDYTTWTKDATATFTDTFCRYTTIPDANFEAWLDTLGYDDISNDGLVPTALIEAATNLNATNQSIANLTGIEDFVALENLYVGNNLLTTLDLSTNLNLKILDVTDNANLATMNVTNNTALEEVFASNSGLTVVNFSNNTALKILAIFDNNLTALDLSNNVNLESLLCQNNDIVDLDLSLNSALTYIDVSNNALTSLNSKNGNNINFTVFNALNNPNLTCILVDDAAWSTDNWTNNKDVTASFNEISCEYVIVDIDVFLQGALLNPNVGEENLMRDDLRVNGHIDSDTPYTDGASISEAVGITDNGNNSIVDWVWVELRDATDPTIVVAGQSAILQRDGDVVDVADDLITPLTFHNVAAGDYYVVVKHRNHLGIMTANTIALKEVISTVNFTDATNQITYGTNAQTTFGMPSGIVAMWAGNVNEDAIVQYSGTTPDVPNILSLVLNDPGNFLNFPTYAVTGYNANDINMDGNTQYSGTNPDTPFILQNVLAHPGNFLNFSTYQIQEQLPEN